MADYTDKSLEVSKAYLKKAKFEFFERLYFYMIPTAQKRVKWLRKKNKLAMLGNHVHWQPRKYPTDGQKLKIHDNVAIASDVEFTMHDVIHWVFDGMAGKREYTEYIGCIEVHENVFIGAGSRILPNVSIGPNAIVAAGSLVNKDVPSGVIVGGVPARIIGSFDELKTTREKYSKKYESLTMSERIEQAWSDFEEERQDNK